MSKQRLVDANTLRQDIWDWAEDVFASEPDNYKFNSVLDVIDSQETFEPPVVHGKWVRPYLSGTKIKNPYWFCSNCGQPVRKSKKSKFCPNCGAKMDKE